MAEALDAATPAQEVECAAVQRAAAAAGFDASFDIKRSEFGVGGYAPAVSDEVRIEITVEAQKAG